MNSMEYSCSADSNSYQSSVEEDDVNSIYSTQSDGFSVDSAEEDVDEDDYPFDSDSSGDGEWGNEDGYSMDSDSDWNESEGEGDSLFGEGDENEVPFEGVERAIEMESRNHSELLRNEIEYRGNVMNATILIDGVEEIPGAVESILRRLKHACTVWTCIGYWLLDRRDLSVSLYYASSNTAISNEGVGTYIDTFGKMRRYIAMLRNFDYSRLITRKDSVYSFIRLAYLKIHVVTFPNFFMRGCENMENFPQKFLRSRFLVVPGKQFLTKLACILGGGRKAKTKRHLRYSLEGHLLPHFKSGYCLENACFFLALALFKNGSQLPSRGCQVTAKVLAPFAHSFATLFSRWLRYSNRVARSAQPSHFPGISLSQIPEAEKVFGLRINIYRFEHFGVRHNTRQPRYIVSPLRLSGLDSSAKYRQTMELLLYDGRDDKGEYFHHIMLIRDLNKLVYQFICNACENKFSCSESLVKHARLRKWRGGVCPMEGEAALSGPWKAKDSLWLEIATTYPGLVNLESQTFQLPFIAAFDTESIHKLHPQNQFIQLGPKQQSTAILRPFLISVVTNIPGFENCQLFWAESETEEGIHDMVSSFCDYLYQACEKQWEIYSERFSPILTHIDWVLDISTQNNNKRVLKQAMSLKRRLLAKISQLPVIGYNATFDLKVLEAYILRIIAQKEGINMHQGLFLLKRAGKYLMFSSKRLRFLDTMNYLGVSMPYESFLLNMGIEGCGKLKIPYEGMTGLERLDDVGLPPLSSPAWNSKLHAGKTLLGDRQWEEFHNVQNKYRLTDEQTLNKLKLKKKPMSPEEDYANLCKHYADKGCITMRQIWAEYSRQDTIPLLQGNLKLASEFASMLGHSVNLFHDFVSLPSLSLKLLSNHLTKTRGGSTGLYVPSLPLMSLIRKHIIGGISVTLVKEAIVGVTPIRSHIYGDSALITQYLTSYDVKSMYPKAMQLLETAGPAILRRAKDGFRAEYDDPLMQQNYWAEVIAAFYGWLWKAVRVKTRMNDGEYSAYSSERRFLVDIVLLLKNGQQVGIENYGHCHYCPWHHPKPEMHQMHPVRKISNWQVYSQDRLRMLQIEREFNGQVFVEYTCRFKKEVVPSHQFQQFLREVPEFSKRFLSRKTFTVETMKKAICDKEIVGLVQCSFSTPPHLKPVFDQFPLLLKRVLVSRTDVDPITRQFCIDNHILEAPRETLIQTFSVKNQLINTRLFRFYLRMGLELEDIRLVVQYQTSNGIASFVDRIMDMRRDAANSKLPDAANFSKRYKLCLNSLYGSFLRQEQKNCKVTVTESAAKLWECRHNMVSCDRIEPVCQATNPIFIIAQKQRKLLHQTPVQVGLDILCTSKKALFSFVYDFLGAFQPRSYCISAVDTDGLVLMFAGRSLEEMESRYLRPDKIAYYHQIKYAYLWDTRRKELEYKPGLMHCEFPQGYSIGVFLASKCYVLAVVDEETKYELLIKAALKGWQSTQRQGISVADFLSVNRNRERREIFLHRLKYSAGQFHFLYYRKCALSYLNLKRYWLPDNLNSLAYDL